MTTDKKSKEIQSNYLSEDSITIADILLIISKQIKLILFLPTFLSLISVIYIYFFSSPVFKSTSKIMSSSNAGSMSQAKGLAAQFGLEIPSTQTEPKWVYPEILKSRTLARSMLKKKIETDVYGSNKTLLQILSEDLQKENIDKKYIEIKAVNRFLDLIQISEDMKTNILTITISTNYPELSVEINNLLINELDSHQKLYNKEKTNETKIFIEERIISIEKELMAAEEKLKIFKDRNRRIENSPALQLGVHRLDREVTVLIGVFTTLKQQLETTKIEEVKDSDYVIIIDPPEIPIIPSNPSAMLFMFLVFALGVILLISFSIFLEFLNNMNEIEKNKLKNAKFFLLKTLKK